jgi:hypothetical protein
VASLFLRLSVSDSKGELLQNILIFTAHIALCRNTFVDAKNRNSGTAVSAMHANDSHILMMGAQQENVVMGEFPQNSEGFLQSALVY